jgi:acyl-CoA dehydrogenase
MGFAVHNAIVAHYVLAYASEAQKARWLPKLASGEWVGAIAMTEPGTGSDLQGIATRAVRDGDFYRLHGAKTFISNGHVCDFVIVAARTSDAKGAAGISLLAAEVSGAPTGFTRGRILDKLGGKGQDTSELFFDDMIVPATNVLGGEEGRGFGQLMQQLPQERLITAVLAQANIERAVDLTVTYTKERDAFGKPLFALQNTRFELAECATLGRVCRLIYAESSMSRPRPWRNIGSAINRASSRIDACSSSAVTAT